MLNNAALQVDWDVDNKKDTEAAKSIFMQAKKENRTLVTEDTKVINHFSEIVHIGAFKVLESLLTEQQILMRILNEKGDETIIWDSLLKKEVKEAEDVFHKYIDKGWKAYAIQFDGTRGRRIKTFRPTMEEISFSDEKLSLKEFRAKFNKIEVLPSTYPG